MIQIKIGFIVFLSLIVICGCGEEIKSRTDGAYTAKEYYKCVNEVKVKHDFFDASIICMSKLSLSNEFFRLSQGNTFFGNRLSKLSKNIGDSVMKFDNLFWDYLSNYCQEAIDEKSRFHTSVLEQYDFNPEAAAKEYCNCVQEENKKHDLLDARILCNSKLSLKNRFFRLLLGHVVFPNRLSQLPKETADSVIRFNDSFTKYIVGIVGMLFQ